MAVRERELIAESRQIHAGLQAELDGLVDDVQRRSAAAKDDSSQVASTGRIVVLIIGIVGAVGALLAAGYFIMRSQAGVAPTALRNPGEPVSVRRDSSAG